MKRRDDERQVLGRCRSSANSNSKVRCKGKLLLLAPLKRGGPSETATSTPVLPWKTHLEQVLVVGGVFSGGGTQQPQQSIIKSKPFSSSPPIPVRKLASAVWEFLQYFSPPRVMDFGGDVDGFRSRLHQHHQRRRRDHHQHHHYLHHRHQLEKGNLGFDDQGGPSHRSPEHQPATASSLRRQVGALLAQHHRTSERNHLPPQPPSPASYGSSLEINAYNHASTPTSSIEFKGRIGESTFGFKTSTELLKVLNRIWTLEEQHVSNISLVKALKTELNHARTRIKELVQDQQASRHEIDELMKQVAEDKLTRKNKEHERIQTTIESLRDELEDERKLRKRSEGLHRRLAREIFEVKVGLSTSLKELEKERTGRCLLEELCDEFANGIIKYEQKNRTGDSSIVHMSESWLDERIQTRDQNKLTASVVDKVRNEIENFLETRKVEASREDVKEFRLRRQSLESFPLNDVGSAPRYTGNEDSMVSTSRLLDTKNEVSEGVDSGTKPTTDEEKAVNEISVLQSTSVKVDHRESKSGTENPVSELLESTSKNSLKAKLQEPKMRVGYRPRLKILKGSS